MHQGNPRAAQIVRQPQAEARRVHGHDDIGLELAHGGRRLPQPLDDAGDVGDDLGHAHQRELLHGKQAFEALCLALRPADAGKARPAACLLLQRANQLAGQIVAGGLARDDEDQRLLPAHQNSF